MIINAANFIMGEPSIDPMPFIIILVMNFIVTKLKACNRRSFTEYLKRVTSFTHFKTV